MLLHAAPHFVRRIPWNFVRNRLEFLSAITTRTNQVAGTHAHPVVINNQKWDWRCFISFIISGTRNKTPPLWYKFAFLSSRQICLLQFFTLTRKPKLYCTVYIMVHFYCINFFMIGELRVKSTVSTLDWSYWKLD